MRDPLEILDDRYDRRSKVVTSQLPVDQWHAYLEDGTVADAILDRLVLKGKSMRKQRATLGVADVPSAGVARGGTRLVR